MTIVATDLLFASLTIRRMTRARMNKIRIIMPATVAVDNPVSLEVGVILIDEWIRVRSERAERPQWFLP